MPDFVTHHLFGDKLNPPPAAAAHPALFRWGLQGPDLFFYRKVLQGSPHHAVAATLHESKTAALLEGMADYCRGLPEDTRPMAEAYLYGFAGHYALDSAVHPYVYAQQACMVAQQPRMTPGAAHSLIECDMDADLYSYLLHGLVCSFCPADHYTLSVPEKKALGALYTHILYSVYGTLMAPGEVVASMQDTLAVQSLLFSGSRLLRGAAGLLDATKGLGSRHYSSHVKGRQPQWDSLNLGHAPWCDPWTEEPRSESVLDLVETAAERYSRLVQLLRRNVGGALLAIPAELNFSGRAL